MKITSQITRLISVRKFAALSALLAFSVGAAGMTARADSAAKPDATPQVKSVTDLFASAEENVGKAVTVEGMATWVCPHMGCKAQLVNADGASKTTLLVTQGKGMPKFSPELKGDTLRVTGILRETRITAADLDEQEREIKNPSSGAEAHDHGDGHDHAKGGDDCANCPDKQKAVDPAKAEQAKQAQLARIAKYREMLAKSKKGYLSSFTFVGQSWVKAE